MSSFPEGAFPGVFTLWRRSLSLKSGLNLLRPFPDSSCWIEDRDFPFPGTSVRIPGKNDSLEPLWSRNSHMDPGSKHLPVIPASPRGPGNSGGGFPDALPKISPGIIWEGRGSARPGCTRSGAGMAGKGWEQPEFPTNFRGYPHRENAELRTEPPGIWGKTDFSFFFFFFNFFPFPPPLSLPAGITEFSPPRTTPPPAWPFPGSAPR